MAFQVEEVVDQRLGGHLDSKRKSHEKSSRFCVILHTIFERMIFLLHQPKYKKNNSLPTHWLRAERDERNLAPIHDRITQISEY